MTDKTKRPAASVIRYVSWVPFAFVIYTLSIFPAGVAYEWLEHWRIHAREPLKALYSPALETIECLGLSESVGEFFETVFRPLCP